MQSLYFYWKGIVPQKSIKLGRKHQNERWNKTIVWERMGKKWRRTWIKTINLDVIREESQEQDNKNDKDYIPEKKGRYEFNTFGKMNDDMPDEYKYHVTVKDLKDRVYTPSKLPSELYMFKRQIEGAIVTIANMLLGREWKPYNKHQTLDLDTLPSMRNILQIKPFFWSNGFECYSWRNNERWNHSHCISEWWFFTKWDWILYRSIIKRKWKATRFSYVWYFYRIEGIISWVRSSHT